MEATERERVRRARIEVAKLAALGTVLGGVGPVILAGLMAPLWGASRLTGVLVVLPIVGALVVLFLVELAGLWRHPDRWTGERVTLKAYLRAVLSPDD